MVREFFCGIGDLVHHSTPTPVPPARRLILLIILGTLPLFAILPIKDTVEGLKNSMVFIGAALIVTGFLLFFSDRARKGRKDARSATVLDVLVVGVSQAIATVPGISRSGMTITTGCFVGFERRFAVRFSFLLSIPAVLGANSPLAVRRGIVVYDPQDNNWCALPGSSNELCTLNGKSLIEKMPLTAGDTFAVGGAQLRFVPLCGTEFNWNAAPKERK
jgi:hypothetical protein